MVKNLKIGDTVKAIFHKFGKKTKFVGIVKEIENNKHNLIGTWVSINVKKGEFNPMWNNLINQGAYNVLIPIKDVQEIVE